MSNKKTYLDDEELILLDSGEIPEIAYHSALHYLCNDPDGPSLVLDDQDFARLQRAVVGRYRWIIMRDLDPANREKRIYRGVARSIANWQRLKDFCARQGFGEVVEPLRQEVAGALRDFLIQERRDVDGGAASSLNCALADLDAFVAELGLVPADLPAGWQQLCP